MDRNVVLSKVIEIINKNMEENKIGVEQAGEDLLQLGMNSIIFIRIVVSLEEEFNCEIPDSKLLITEMKNVNNFVDVLMSVLS